SAQATAPAAGSNSRLHATKNLHYLPRSSVARQGIAAIDANNATSHQVGSIARTEKANRGGRVDLAHARQRRHSAASDQASA
ncbi:MAG: hypothetical protein GY788_28305, partial [bacterium]|nr:hypothetical protein [bacterium]